MKGIRKAVLTAAVMLAAVPFCFADPGDASRRIERLEGELQELREGVEAGAPEQHGRRAVWSSLDITLYGYVKLDASYDSSETHNGNFAMWVRRGDDYGDGEFNMSARETRLGLNIIGPGAGAMQSSGVIEIDFCGSGGENTAEPRMRLAYLELDWPESGFTLTAGQDWDVISPLNPQMLNTSPLWWAGNIGVRRPQIRATQAFGADEGPGLTLTGALLRTIGRTGNTFRDPERESGAASGHPSAQARIGFRLPVLDAGTTDLGLSGHWGREKYDSDDDSTERFRSWSANFDIVQPVTEWLTLRGEAFIGKNLSAYLGGIGQGVNVQQESEIRGAGGWTAAALTPVEKWTFNLGAGLDDARREDLNRGDRKMNSAVFANGIYSITDNISAGLELSHWQTKYRGEGDEENLRVQTSLTFRF